MSIIPYQCLKVKMEDQKEPERPEDRGLPGFLTQKEFDTLQEFKQVATMKDHVLFNDDGVLLRFLRARDFNIKKTSKMLQEHIEWREDFPEGRPYSIEEFPTPHTFFLNHLAYVGGFDKGGRPLIILNANRSFPRKIKDMGEIVYFFVCYMDALCRFCAEHGCYEITAIADLKGFSISKNFSLSMTKILAALFQDQYPETLFRAMLINTPFGFSSLWNVISPLLEDRVKAKIKVVNKNYAKLQEFVEPKYLLKEWGKNLLFFIYFFNIFISLNIYIY